MIINIPMFVTMVIWRKSSIEVLPNIKPHCGASGGINVDACTHCAYLFLSMLYFLRYVLFCTVLRYYVYIYVYFQVLGRQILSYNNYETIRALFQPYLKYFTACSII